MCAPSPRRSPRAGVECDVFTRADHAEQPPVVDLEPGVRVIHLDAGPHGPVPKAALPGLVDDLVAAAAVHLGTDDYDTIHAHYWISGAVGHVLKHTLDLPLVTTFHTLAHVKAAAGLDDDPRARPRGGRGGALLGSHRRVDRRGARRARRPRTAPTRSASR